MRWLPLLLVALAVRPAPASAQVPIAVSGFAGGAFPTDDSSPGDRGGGFAFQTRVGLHYSRVAFGGEFGQYTTTSALKARVYGGFVRFSSLSSGVAQLYLVVGLGAYRFSPSTGSSSTVLGGSLGPGVSLALGDSPARILMEARFHSTFDQLRSLNRQQYVAVLGGLELRF
jgi:hypothetical protein